MISPICKLALATILAGGIVLSASDAANAQAPFDFYIVFKTCKMMMASSASPEKGVKVVGDDESAPTWGCLNPGKRKASCVATLDEGTDHQTATKVELVIDLDVSDVLVLHDDNFVNWVWIDRPSRTATLTSRLIVQLSATVIATRLCQGLYLTTDEAKALHNPSKAKK